MLWSCSVLQTSKGTDLCQMTNTLSPPPMNNSCSWFLLGKKNTFYFCYVPRHSLEQLAALRILQIIVYFSDRSRKVAQQDQFWKRSYEYIQNSVHSWVRVLYVQCLCFGRKWWLRLMLVHIHQNWYFLDCLFKQRLWRSFQLASPRLAADGFLMGSHLHCYLESPFGNNSPITDSRKQRQHYQNHLPWAIQMKSLEERISNLHIL